MNFFERLKQGVIVGDGAMGTQLYEKGIPKGHCFDELNISHPEIVQEIHNAYISAGAEIIETNTFGANSYVLGKYYDLADKTEEINVKGVKLARLSVSQAKEVSKNIFVAGSIGPITRPYESKEELSLSEIHTIFKEQISALVSAGADILIFETFSNVEELIEGYKTAKEVCGGGSKCHLPVICQLSYTREGRTLLGMDAVESAIKLKEAGASIIGANCGSGPQDIYEVLSRIGSVTDVVLSAYPNAGLPSFSQGKFIYPATPQYFAEYAKKYVELGVSIIGGCCGTTPEHIEAIVNAVAGKQPKPRRVIQFHPSEKKLQGRDRSLDLSHRATSISPTSLQKKIGKKFIITVEIDPPKGTDYNKEIEVVKHLASLGIDCGNISDNPMARLRMSAIPLASIIKRETNLDVILHCTCRGRNLLTIQSDLLGAYAIGIRNILALTGDPPSVGDYPFASASYDMTSKELIEVISSLNNGIDWLGNPLPSGTAFFAGTSGNLDNIKLVQEKVKKGASFIQTQPVFDLKELEAFVKAVDVPVIAGLLPLASLKHSEFIQNEAPGIDIPEEIMSRMRQGNKDEGIKIARELFNELKEICAGVCIMPPFGRYEIVDEIIS